MRAQERAELITAMAMATQPRGGMAFVHASATKGTPTTSRPRRRAQLQTLLANVPIYQTRRYGVLPGRHLVDSSGLLGCHGLPLSRGPHASPIDSATPPSRR